MSLVQSARYVGAHHSYPKDLVELIIESGGNSYHYKWAGDSDRPDEYWILERGRSVEPWAARSTRPDSPARPHAGPLARAEALAKPHHMPRVRFVQ